MCSKPLQIPNYLPFPSHFRFLTKYFKFFLFLLLHLFLSAVSSPVLSFQGPGQPSQRVFTGTVTKLHDNFGFVDEDVFFQSNVVKGAEPKVNVRREEARLGGANVPLWTKTISPFLSF
jgi:hypothetical protein